MKKIIRISHRLTGELIAEGPSGWGITPFEGNYYIGRKYLRTNSFKISFVPGFCFYKFFYVWLNFHSNHGIIDRFLGWMYFLPNPLLPFIWFRVAVPQHHPLLRVEEIFVNNKYTNAA